MNEKCRGWVSNSAKKADEFYRAMADWIISRRPLAKVGELIKAGSAYRWALSQAIKCLQSMKRTDQVTKKIEQTKEYEALVTAEIKALRELD